MFLELFKTRVKYDVRQTINTLLLDPFAKIITSYSNTCAENDQLRYITFDY